MPQHDAHIYRILDEIQATSGVSQRALARRTGIALGLTNLLVRGMIRQGLVRMRRVGMNRVTYHITSAGAREKVRVGRACLAHGLRAYSDVKSRICARLAELSEACELETARRGDRAPIVFYGAGEIAEVAYLCLSNWNLALVGVVDAAKSTTSFGVRVYQPADLSERALDGQPFLRVFVTELNDHQNIRRILHARGIDEARVCWI